MLVTNWVTVFLLGVWCGQRKPSREPSSKTLPVYLCSQIALILLWPIALGHFGMGRWVSFHADGGRNAQRLH